MKSNNSYRNKYMLADTNCLSLVEQLPHCNQRVKTLDLAKGKQTKDGIIKRYPVPLTPSRVTEYYTFSNF